MIRDIDIIQIYNSRGEPTIEAKIVTEHGVFSAQAPTGKSRSRWEAKYVSPELGIKAFRSIKNNFIGLKEDDIELFDEQLEQFSMRIGTSITTALSVSVARASCQNRLYNLFGKRRIFPYPVVNVLGGGAHGGNTSIQEFLVIPSGAKDFPGAVKNIVELWKEVGLRLKKYGYNPGRNDEGAWMTRQNEIKTLDMLSKIADEYDCALGVDIAASHIFKKGRYLYPSLGKFFNSGEQLEFIKHLIKTYRLIYVEDPFHENDFSSFSELRRYTNALIVGDDLYGTQSERLKTGITKSATNAIIIKPDQAGTLTRVIETVKLAIENKIVPVLSHRSGETTDNYIMDLAIAFSAPLIKCGVGGGERIAKLNRGLELWHEFEEKKMAKIRMWK